MEYSIESKSWWFRYTFDRCSAQQCCSM